MLIWQFTNISPKTAGNKGEYVLHVLDARRVLQDYLNRTKSFMKSSKLVVSYAKNHSVSAQTISSWVKQCITECYKFAEVCVLTVLWPYSTRAVAAFFACPKHLPIEEICKAVSWKSVHTFTKYYTLDLVLRADAKFGRVVLWLLFNWDSVSTFWTFNTACQTTHKWEFADPLKEEMKVAGTRSSLRWLYIHTSHAPSPLLQSHCCFSGLAMEGTEVAEGTVAPLYSLMLQHSKILRGGGEGRGTCAQRALLEESSAVRCHQMMQYP